MGTGTSLITVYDHHHVIGVFYLCSRESTVYFLTPFFFNTTKKKKKTLLAHVTLGVYSICWQIVCIFVLRRLVSKV